jgi:hypothetical protein
VDSITNTVITTTDLQGIMGRMTEVVGEEVLHVDGEGEVTEI